ncbi:MAG TPA: hypothetical protein VHN37_13405 [Actinomycetota bacterium]|nr:hypothetical protein [Actinomycetota bacterium]
MRALDPGTLLLLLEIVRSLIDDDRERGRAALEAVGILNPRTPEVDAVWEHLKMLNAPVLVDAEFTITAQMVQEIAGAGFDPRSSAFQTLRKVGIPGVIITVNRMSFGLASLLGRLEATNNWQAIMREMWFGEEPATQMGREEQEWLASAHPDLVPPLADQ